jgi:hypothetical protein
LIRGINVAQRIRSGVVPSTKIGAGKFPGASTGYDSRDAL